VVFEPGNGFTYRDVSADHVREINLEMAWHAYELVIARDEPLLRSGVESTLAERRSRGSKWGGSKLVNRLTAEGADELARLRATGIEVNAGTSADAILRNLVKKDYAEQLPG
jgi:hypothetical protein